jgi:hypothetical protein
MSQMSAQLEAALPRASPSVVDAEALSDVVEAALFFRDRALAAERDADSARAVAAGVRQRSEQQRQQIDAIRADFDRAVSVLKLRDPSLTDATSCEVTGPCIPDCAALRSAIAAGRRECVTLSRYLGMRDFCLPGPSHLPVGTPDEVAAPYLLAEHVAVGDALKFLLRRRVDALESGGKPVADKEALEEFGSVSEMAKEIARLRDASDRLRLREARFDTDPLLARRAADDATLRVLVAALQNELGHARALIAANSLFEVPTLLAASRTPMSPPAAPPSFSRLVELANSVFAAPSVPAEPWEETLGLPLLPADERRQTIAVQAERGDTSPILPLGTSTRVRQLADSYEADAKAILAGLQAEDSETKDLRVDSWPDLPAVDESVPDGPAASLTARLTAAANLGRHLAAQISELRFAIDCNDEFSLIIDDLRNDMARAHAASPFERAPLRIDALLRLLIPLCAQNRRLLRVVAARDASIAAMQGTIERAAAEKQRAVSAALQLTKRLSRAQDAIEAARLREREATETSRAVAAVAESAVRAVGFLDSHHPSVCDDDLGQLYAQALGAHFRRAAAAVKLQAVFRGFLVRSGRRGASEDLCPSQCPPLRPHAPLLPSILASASPAERLVMVAGGVDAHSAWRTALAATASSVRGPLVSGVEHLLLQFQADLGETCSQLQHAMDGYLLRPLGSRGAQTLPVPAGDASMQWEAPELQETAAPAPKPGKKGALKPTGP